MFFFHKEVDSKEEIQKPIKISLKGKLIIIWSNKEEQNLPLSKLGQNLH